MAFSADGRLLVAQGGAPDWTLCLWAWEKSKLVASVRTVTQPGHAAAQCAFQPGGWVLVEWTAQQEPCFCRPQRDLACPHVQSAPNRRLTDCRRYLPSPGLRSLAGDDPHLISVVGEGTCCLYQIEAGNTLRPLPTALTKRESQGYACHAWLLDGDAAGSEAAFVVGTKRGEVLVVAHGEVKQALALEDGAGMTSLAAHSKVGA